MYADPGATGGREGRTRGFLGFCVWVGACSGAGSAAGRYSDGVSGALPREGFRAASVGLVAVVAVKVCLGCRRTRCCTEALRGWTATVLHEDPLLHGSTPRMDSNSTARGPAAAPKQSGGCGPGHSPALAVRWDTAYPLASQLPLPAPPEGLACCFRAARQFA